MTNRTPEEIARGLTELAERCEKASGPDRELDLDIEVAVGNYTIGKAPPDYDGTNESEIYIPASGIPSGFSYPPKGAIGRHYHVRRVPYTASIDAAMTLAKEFGGQVTFFKDGTAKAFLWQPYPMAVEVKAATPTLALCAAALRGLGTLS